MRVGRCCPVTCHLQGVCVFCPRPQCKVYHANFFRSSLDASAKIGVFFVHLTQLGPRHDRRHETYGKATGAIVDREASRRNSRCATYNFASMAQHQEVSASIREIRQTRSLSRKRFTSIHRQSNRVIVTAICPHVRSHVETQAWRIS